MYVIGVTQVSYKIEVTKPLPFGSKKDPSGLTENSIKKSWYGARYGGEKVAS